MTEFREKYVEMSDPMYDTIEKRVQKSYPNSCICYIIEIFNDVLLKNFKDKELELNNRLAKPAVIKQLFHGTNEHAIKPICETGYLTKFNTTSAYGKGTYFARDARYSYNYMRPSKPGELSYMFFADVLVGNMKRGSSNEIPTTLLDNFVDNMNNPSIYVTTHDSGAYPRYVIGFHKNAQ